MSTFLQQGREGTTLTDVEIIDLHGHLGRFLFTVPDISAKGLIAVMDRIGVSKIVASAMLAWSADTEHGNEEIYKAMKDYPGRILGYVSIWPSDPDTVKRNVTHWLECGFTGLKLHNSNGFPYLDDAYLPAYGIAHERRMPMLFHTWGQTEELSIIGKIAEKYPDTSILLAHSGSCNEQGYIEIAQKHGNIYLDLAYSQAPRGLVKRFVEAVGADKITWGSDCYFFSMTQQIGKVLGSDISEEDKVHILSANAQRILNRIS